MDANSQEERHVSARRLPDDAAGVAEAARLLRAGQLVSFPTETVYGLGADATDGAAVAAIYEAKGRPSFNPLIVHVPSLSDAETLARFDPGARALADAFWPGPLTLVVPRRPGALSDLVTAGLETVAIRVPAHPLARALLAAVGRPVAAPSANPSGRISPTTAEHVLQGLGDRIATVLDGGPCAVGLESTILGWNGPDPVLLRPGGLPAEALQGALGTVPRAAVASDGVAAPGMLTSHYAPRAGVRLDVTDPNTGEIWLGFGDCPGAMRNLSPTGDLREAAANLFSHLRALDAAAPEGTTIAVAPVPEHGLGVAINDRLRRAAAPRDG
ncbi:MAG: L-threonylcarbamoyladenylate synthase [Pseudomonadota bacterium]